MGTGERIRLRNDLDWREIEGEVVVLDAETSNYFGISKTGAAIWPRLAEGATKDELVTVLLDRFDVDEATAGRDLDAFLGMLAERRLVTSDAP